MNKETLDIQEEEAMDPKMIKAKKMLLVVGIISIIMMFSGLTSAYIVSRGGAPFWVNIKIPQAFWYSTIVMILSSGTMILALRAAKSGKIALRNGMLALSLILGLTFVYSQFQGWGEMVDNGLYLRGDFLENLKGDYGTDYVITEQKSGLMVEYKDGHYFDPSDPTGTKMIDEEIATMRNPASSYMTFLTGIHAIHVGGGILYLIYLLILGLIGRTGAKFTLKVNQGAVYWHFVDLLWIYLLLFLHFIH
jgi:cytochrome c oxidase subunit 3